MNETVKKFREIFIQNLTRQLKTESGISTRINMYMVEVQLLKDLLQMFTGTDDYSDTFHDYCCSIIDEVHKEFDQ